MGSHRTNALSLSPFLVSTSSVWHQSQQSCSSCLQHSRSSFLLLICEKLKAHFIQELNPSPRIWPVAGQTWVPIPAPVTMARELEDTDWFKPGQPSSGQGTWPGNLGQWERQGRWKRMPRKQTANKCPLLPSCKTDGSLAPGRGSRESVA